MFVPLRRTQIILWRFHTNHYKFVWNIISNNSSTEYRTDLRLGQSPYLFMVYNVSISWLHSVEWVFDFYFDGMTVKTSNKWMIIAVIYKTKRVVNNKFTQWPAPSWLDSSIGRALNSIAEYGYFLELHNGRLCHSSFFSKSLHVTISKLHLKKSK